MKGKAAGKTGPKSMTAYAGGSSNVASESKGSTSGFKKGGLAAEGVMSKAHAGRKPRKSGGGVFSSASGGSPRGKTSHY